MVTAKSVTLSSRERARTCVQEGREVVQDQLYSWPVILELTSPSNHPQRSKIGLFSSTADVKAVWSAR